MFSLQFEIPVYWCCRKVEQMLYNCRFLNLKKKAKTIAESKNKQEKVTAKYITQKRQ